MINDFGRVRSLTRCHFFFDQRVPVPSLLLCRPHRSVHYYRTQLFLISNNLAHHILKAKAIQDASHV